MHFWAFYACMMSFLSSCPPSVHWGSLPTWHAIAQAFWQSLPCLYVSSYGIWRLPQTLSRYREQMCQFHYIMIVRRYLTNNPELSELQELLCLARNMFHTDRTTSVRELERWHGRREGFLMTTKRPYDILPFCSKIYSGSFLGYNYYMCYYWGTLWYQYAKCTIVIYW